MTRSIQYAIYLSIFISFVRRILAKARVEPTGHWLSPDATEEPEYTVFVIPDSDHRCLVADIYKSLTDDEKSSIEQRMNGIFHGFSCFARYDPQFARGCSAHVDLFELHSNRHPELVTLKMAIEARKAIMSILPIGTYRML